MTRRLALACLLLVLTWIVGCSGPQLEPAVPASDEDEIAAEAENGLQPEEAARPEPKETVATMDFDPSKKEDEAYWRKKLSAEEYRILREKGTERAFSGEYYDTKTKGTYKCAGCGEALFESDAKFDSGCGWPSFFKPLEGARVTETRDTTHGMIRTEITCSKCGGHLGHVFTDGPAPTGLRYCINSVSIDLEPGKASPGAKAPAEPAAGDSKPTAEDG